MRVAAVVLEPAAATAGAVRAQTRAPDELVEARTDGAGRAGAFARALESPVARDADWLWLLDAGVAPEPGALEALLVPLAEPGAPPAVLASKVVAPDGSLDPAAAPWHRLTDKETAVEATAHRLVSIRAARHGSLLVARSAIERHGLPRADYVTAGDDLEWTGRILSSERGYLVPASVAVRRAAAGGHDAHRDVRNRVDMLRRGTWDGQERLWFGLSLAEDVARGLRGRERRSVLRGLRDGLVRR